MALHLNKLYLHRRPVALVGNCGSLNRKLRTSGCALHASRLQSDVQPAEAGGGASGPPRRPRQSHGGYGRGGRREPFRPGSTWSILLKLASSRVPECIGMLAMSLGIGLGLHSVGQGISSTGASVTKAAEQLGGSLVTAGTQLGSNLATKTFQPENKSQGLAGATSVLGEKALEIAAILAVGKLCEKLVDVLVSWWKPRPPPV
ncbi:hypothetical protein Vretimale_8611 [Volvox reticuliferus]|uniref:Uncharacterized protein n=1 Tax=Volvox reticuliferus TaxID=1737510 RepID=A0A8J4LNH3_9CHLO|nr:hypothetical protein Vretimale_8611 [Volvox reticuliferus]